MRKGLAMPRTWPMAPSSANRKLNFEDLTPFREKT